MSIKNISNRKKVGTGNMYSTNRETFKVADKQDTAGFEEATWLKNEAEIVDNESEEREYTKEEPFESELGASILEGAVPCNTRPQESVARGGEGGISIVNCECGRRVEFSKKLLAALGEPVYVDFFFHEKYLIVKTTDQKKFTLKKISTRKVIYSASLVKEITKQFSLDFSNRSCISFSDYEIIKDKCAIAAIFKIK